MTKIHILEDGTLQFLYDDDLKPLIDLGESKIRRASTVDPRYENDRIVWYADLALSQGPELGPFDTREQALVAEQEWLNTHYLTTNH